MYLSIPTAIVVRKLLATLQIKQVTKRINIIVLNQMGKMATSLNAT